MQKSTTTNGNPVIAPPIPTTIEGRCDVETQVLNKLKGFFSSNPDLEPAMKQAQKNVDQANQTTQAAQSGELINQVQIPSSGPIDTLHPNPTQQIINRKQQEDPERFAENSINYPRLAEQAKWLASI